MDQTLTTLTSIFHHGPEGMTLIDYLCRRFTYKDRAAWVAAINEGSVVVNDLVTSPTHVLKTHDRVSYTSNRSEPTVATDITTLYEDEALLVVNKPAPLLVHSNRMFINNTLIALLRARTGNQDLSLGHRLDGETTGILVLAKTRELTAKLMALLDEVRATKTYLAVARGQVDFEEKLVTGWMGSKPHSLIHTRQEFSAAPADGYKKSSTRFTLKERLNGYSVLACELQTGRTHQIRVHLEALGFPIAGDKLYGRTDEDFLNYQAHFKKTLDFNGGGTWEHPRQLLHAWKLSMNHPVTGVHMHWEAPVPGDMQRFIDAHHCS